MIDLGVLSDDSLGQLARRAVERIDRVADLALRETAHLGDHARQLLEFLVEGLVRCVPYDHFVIRSLASAEPAGDVVLSPLVVGAVKIFWSCRTRPARRDT